MANTVVGLFDSIAEAQRARTQLVTQGYTDSDMRVIAENQDTSSSAARATSAGAGETHGSGVLESIKHFFSSMTGAEENDYEYYSQGVGRGGALLAITVPEDRTDSTVSLLRQYGARDIDNEGGADTFSSGAQRSRTTAATTGENVSIPVVEEELQVGKRQVNRGGVRVYSRVVETPIEENVRLREEHVRVERHPVNRPASEADFQAFKEGAVEVTETAEQAVVSKQARVVEEVTVGKDATERTETVRDTVRRTEVDVEDAIPDQTKRSTTSGR